MVDEDETVEVGAELALIGDGAAPTPAARRQQATSTGRGSTGSTEPAARAPATRSRRARAQEPTRPRSSPPPSAPSRSSRPQRQPRRRRQPAPAAPQPPQPGRSAAEPPAATRRTSRRWCASSPPQHGVDLAPLTRHRRRRAHPQAGRARRRREAVQPRGRGGSPRRRARPLHAAAPAAARASRRPLRGTTEKMTRLRKVIAEPDGRVAAGLGPADHRGRGRRHQDRPAARPGARRLRGARGRQAVVPAVLRPGGGRGAQGAPEGQRHASTGGRRSPTTAQREPRRRGRHRARAAGAGDQGRRRPNIAGLARKIADLADRTRNNKITPDELAGGTFTLTNTGSRGALFDTPIINQPQVAILGTGAVVKRPVVIDRRRRSARRSRSGRWCTSRCPTTTASSTAPTPPASSRRQAAPGGRRVRGRARVLTHAGRHRWRLGFPRYRADAAPAPARSPGHPPGPLGEPADDASLWDPHTGRIDPDRHRSGRRGRQSLRSVGVLAGHAPTSVAS